MVALRSCLGARALLLLTVLLCCLSFVMCAKPTCTDANLTGEYTRCLSLTDTRSLYFYYDGQCDPSQSLAPPSPISGLPCNISCDPGTFLPLNGTTCSTCPAGTFSMGGGERYYLWRNSFPRSQNVLFRTYCSSLDSVEPSDEYPSSCGWTLDGYETSSGNLEGLDSLNSILELSVAMLVDGHVSFSFMFDVEQTGDVFAYKVDNNRPIAFPTTPEYQKIGFALSAGAHTIRWIYYKNPVTSQGRGVARISWVEIYGLQAADDIECTPCPMGGYQPEEGQNICIKCPVNTYMDEEGATECKSCEHGYAAEGSTECIDFTRNCTTDDAIRLHTDCMQTNQGWQQTIYYQWATPLFCDNSGVSLPVAEDVTCEPCQGSAVYDPVKGCVYCEDGFYRTSTDDCAQCPTGTAAVPEMVYADWSSVLPAPFATECYGACLTRGWSSSQDFVRATITAGKRSDMVLQLPLQILFGGEVEYTWSIEGDMEGSEFEVTINGLSVMSRTSGTSVTSRHSLRYGSHTIGFWAHASGYGTASISITQVTVRGGSVGGTEECMPCPAGYHQPNAGESECLPCPYGYYTSEEGSVRCNKCPLNTYAAQMGSSSCQACANGTQTLSEGASYCQNPSCTFTAADGVSMYNLSPYAGIPQYVENEEAYTGYFLVSYCGLLKDSDSKCRDSYVCETYDRFNPLDPTTSTLNWGSDFHFQEKEDPHAGFSLVFTDGSQIGCENETRTAEVDFTCAVEDTTPLQLSDERSTSCHLVFTQRTVYGCPVCGSDAFERVPGECEDGKMVVQYPKKEGAMCNGVIKDTVESCGNLTLNFGLAVVLGLFVVLALLALIVVIVVFVLKNRRLKVKYSSLRASNVEMENLDEEVEA